MKEVVVTIAHVRQLRGYTKRNGYCVPGLKVWFAAQGLDWRAFVREGIPAHKLIETGDALAVEAVELVLKLEGANK